MNGRPRGDRIFALLALLWLALGAASAAIYREDALVRGAVERFQSRFGIDRRRPLETASVRLAPSGDWACAIAAESALADAAGSVRLSGMDADSRRLWLRAVADRGEEIGGAAALMRRAVRARPGWGYHAFLLGQLAYAAESRDPTAAPDPSRFARWRDPVRAAASLDRADDAVWAFLASAYLRNWTALPPDALAESRPLFRRAMLDAGFVSRALPLVADAVGNSAALALLAERPDVLRSAIAAWEPLGDPEGTAELERRWESAERYARERDLARARDRFRIGDGDGLRAACAAWARNHPVSDFDDAAARAQAAALLRIWPPDRGAEWREDPRAAMVRYFLDGREGSVPGAVLDNAVGALEGVPETVRARAKLLAGDREAAERIFTSSATIGSFEWTAYLAEAARGHLRDGRWEDARRALSRIAPAAREECDVLLVRRDLANALGDGKAEAEASLSLERRRRERFPAGDWSARGTLPLCLDPRWTAGRFLEVHVESSVPAVVAWGWNEARSGTIAASPGARIRVPLNGLAGLRTFWVRAPLGRPVTASAVIVPEGSGAAASGKVAPQPLGRLHLAVRGRRGHAVARCRSSIASRSCSPKRSSSSRTRSTRGGWLASGRGGRRSSRDISFRQGSLSICRRAKTGCAAAVRDGSRTCRSFPDTSSSGETGARGSSRSRARS